MPALCRLYREVDEILRQRFAFPLRIDVPYLGRLTIIAALRMVSSRKKKVVRFVSSRHLKLPRSLRKSLRDDLLRALDVFSHELSYPGELFSSGASVELHHAGQHERIGDAVGNPVEAPDGLRGRTVGIDYYYSFEASPEDAVHLEFRKSTLGGHRRGVLTRRYLKQTVAILQPPRVV